MKLNNEKADFLKNAIDEWLQKGIITNEQADAMKNSIEPQKFDWKQLTVYAFIIAVVCVILSIIVLLADKPLRMLIEKFTQITDFGISSILSVVTVVLLWYSKFRFKKYNNTPFSNNSFLMCAAFLSLATLAYWAKTFHVLENNYVIVFFIASAMYIVMALYFKSSIVWLLSLMMFTFSYTAIGMYQNQLFGMNYLLRYIPFCIVLLVISYFIYDTERLQKFFKVQYVYSLLLFFIVLWLLSIFGNTTAWQRWQNIKQYNFVIWSILLFVITLVCMYYAVRKNDLILGNIALAFFILNLITRYFEYFWQPLHKSVFFMILAIIFWIIGSRAEKWWNLKFLEK